MKTSLEYSDITEELCKVCGECCKIQIPIALDERYYDYLIALGFNIILDFSDLKNGLLDLGYCKHLKKDGDKFYCEIYEKRPKLCRDYNCVAWAKYVNVEKESLNLQHALKVYNDTVSN